MTREAQIQQEIRLAATKAGARVFRNQVGHYELSDGRHITSGLCVGSSDLIGWTTISNVAIFTSIEVKNESGRPTDEQRAWIDTVIRSGGIAGIARSAAEAVALIEERRRKGL